MDSNSSNMVCMHIYIRLHIAHMYISIILLLLLHIYIRIHTYINPHALCPLFAISNTWLSTCSSPQLSSGVVLTNDTLVGHVGTRHPRRPKVAQSATLNPPGKTFLISEGNNDSKDSTHPTDPVIKFSRYLSHKFTHLDVSKLALVWIEVQLHRPKQRP